MADRSHNDSKEAHKHVLIQAKHMKQIDCWGWLFTVRVALSVRMGAHAMGLAQCAFEATWNGRELTTLGLWA